LCDRPRQFFKAFQVQRSGICTARASGHNDWYRVGGAGGILLSENQASLRGARNMSERKSVVELDATNVFEDAIGEEHGLSREHLQGLAGRIERHVQEIERRRGKDIGFMELPYDTELAATIREKAEELRGWCRNFVVLGIGGSALGNIAVHGALNHAFHNLLPAGHEARLGAPRIFVLDNVDPALMAAFLDTVEDELDSTAFNVITKSGSTAETMSQFLHVRELLRRKGLDPARQIIATTDPRADKSLLRRIVKAGGHFSLPVPANVGGRFSVLTAVGLLSAAVGGVDVEKLLAGAAAMDERCRSGGLEANPAALYAAILYLFYEAGKPITVLMPYCNALRRLADWYCQLWAESLGKKEGLHEKEVYVGPTPVGAVGVTDQHSVMQLFQDGKFDKVITLIEVEEAHGQGVGICREEVEQELGYLRGRTFNELFAAELKATRAALRDKHRPNITLKAPRLDAAVLGELFLFFEYAVTYSGCLYDVNAFDQPGVELGKVYTYGLMGRPGYEGPKGS
jgi:glucose-6-phosphate isomerase